mmetsp:Transcript_60422/g.168838  ORF Transcript_60422/g.168838 Transcript_60422/m.168838 type:complete len:222 (-) Transcript_60422:34-699(-)
MCPGASTGSQDSVRLKDRPRGSPMRRPLLVVVGRGTVDRSATAIFARGSAESATPPQKAHEAIAHAASRGLVLVVKRFVGGAAEDHAQAHTYLTPRFALQAERLAARLVEVFVARNVTREVLSCRNISRVHSGDGWRSPEAAILVSHFCCGGSAAAQGASRKGHVVGANASERLFSATVVQQGTQTPAAKEFVDGGVVSLGSERDADRIWTRGGLSQDQTA